MQSPTDDRTQNHLFSCRIKPPALNSLLMSAAKFPTVLWSVPVLSLVLIGWQWAGRASDVLPRWLPELLAAWFGFYLVCVFQWHHRLELRFKDYPLKDRLAVAFSLIAGPPAAWLATHLVELVARGLLLVDDLVLEMFPNSVAIVHSAIYLVDQFAAVLAVVIGLGAAVWCQARIGATYAQATGLSGTAKAQVAAFAWLLGIALSLPGSLVVLQQATIGVRLEPLSPSLLLLLAFCCAIVSSLSLSFIQTRRA